MNAFGLSPRNLRRASSASAEIQATAMKNRVTPALSRASAGSLMGPITNLSRERATISNSLSPIASNRRFPYQLRLVQIDRI